MENHDQFLESLRRQVCGDIPPIKESEYVVEEVKEPVETQPQPHFYQIFLEIKDIERQLATLQKRKAALLAIYED